MPPLAGRILHLKLDVIARPRDRHAETGATDAATEIGEKLSLEIGLLAQRLAGEGYTVKVGRSIKVY